VINSKGCELLKVKLVKTQKKWILKVFIDKEGGVTLDTCAEVSRILGPTLDVKAAIPRSYILEVSSPGSLCLPKNKRCFK
jgi:ribosome maturation factor RimP